MGFLARPLGFIQRDNSQVYAFAAVLLGVWLNIHAHDIGRELVVGGFALLRVSTGNVEHVDVAKANTVKVDTNV